MSETGSAFILGDLAPDLKGSGERQLASGPAAGVNVAGSASAAPNRSVTSKEKHRCESSTLGAEVGRLPLVEPGGGKQQTASVGVEPDVHLARQDRSVDHHLPLAGWGQVLGDVVRRENRSPNRAREFVPAIDGFAAVSGDRLEKQILAVAPELIRVVS